MSKKAYRYIVLIGGAICLYALIRSLIFIQTRPMRTNVIQGIIIGFGLALATAQITAELKTSRVNGWVTMYRLGLPDNNMLMRAACALAFPGPVNTPQEAMYWTTVKDSLNRELTGEREYILHFPADGLPPNKAFWSLTMGDVNNRFVENPINRYSVSDRSGLVSNADDSVDIYIQKTAPAGFESNWLPAPAGGFILWLRIYMPDAEILDGKYIVPPVTEVK